MRAPIATGLVLALAFALGALAPIRALAEPPELFAGVFDPPREAPVFSLGGSDGQPISLERFRGKIVVLAFGFTSCPDVCPTTLATLAGARRALGPAAADVQVVYVTVDPQRDDAKRMREYLVAFDPAFLGATGSAEELAKVREAYGVAAERVARGKTYAFSHSSFTYLIDRDGKLRALMPYGHAANDYAHDLRILLGS
ncbi:MAG TPA: SCO family protein [Myxococcota bacterium]|nr:SCO family protein [Myxococcota bacterium]